MVVVARERALAHQATRSSLLVKTTAPQRVTTPNLFVADPLGADTIFGLNLSSQAQAHRLACFMSATLLLLLKCKLVTVDPTQFDVACGSLCRRAADATESPHGGGGEGPQGRGQLVRVGCSSCTLQQREPVRTRYQCCTAWAVLQVPIRNGCTGGA